MSPKIKTTQRHIVLSSSKCENDSCGICGNFSTQNEENFEKYCEHDSYNGILCGKPINSKLDFQQCYSNYTHNLNQEKFRYK